MSVISVSGGNDEGGRDTNVTIDGAVEDQGLKDEVPLRLETFPDESEGVERVDPFGL